jgi:nitrogen fixation protein NifU and related proteins
MADSQPDADREEAYSALVIEHFHRPRNAGELLRGPGVIWTQAGTRAAGAEVALSMRFSAGAVEEVRFQAFGCPHFLAAASLATERLPGLHLDQLVRWQAREIGQELAVPVEKRGRLLILEDAVRAAAQYSAT